MTETSLPEEALCTVEEAVHEGADVLPDDGFEYTGQSSHPNSVKRAALAELEERLEDPDAPDVEAVNVGDAADLDGSTATAILRHKFGGTETPDFEAHDDPMEALFNDDAYGGTLISLPASYRGYYPDPEAVLEEALDVLEEHGATDIPVYYTDLGVNEDNENAMVEQFSRANPVFVRDHHQKREAAVEAADEYVWTDEKCASEIVLETDHADAPDYLREFVEGPARVRDLWLDDHPDFEEHAVFGDAQFHLGDATMERLIAAHGADLLEIPGLGEELERRHAVKMAKIEYAVENAEFHTVETSAHPDGEVTVGLAKGDAYSSELGRRLYTEGYGDDTADLAVIVKPGGDVSMRASDDFPVCYLVADELGGGGHHAAAGFSNTASDDATLDVKAKIAFAEVSRVLKGLSPEDVPEEA